MQAFGRLLPTSGSLLLLRLKARVCDRTDGWPLRSEISILACYQVLFVQVCKPWRQLVEQTPTLFSEPLTLLVEDRCYDWFDPAEQAEVRTQSLPQCMLCINDAHQNDAQQDPSVALKGCCHPMPDSCF